LGKSKKSLPGGAGQRDLSKNAIKKGHELKTVVSDFLPEVRAQSVRFTLARAVVDGYLVPTYIPILLTYPNRLRKDCRDGSGNQYPSRITRIRPGFFCWFQPAGRCEFTVKGIVYYKNHWAPQTCAYVRYAPAKCGKFDVSQCFFQFCYHYLEI